MAIGVAGLGVGVVVDAGVGGDDGAVDREGGDDNGGGVVVVAVAVAGPSPEEEALAESMEGTAGTVSGCRLRRQMRC